MKKSQLIFLVLILSFGIAKAGGVCVIDSDKQQYLKLLKKQITVSVENQIAIVKSIQTFKNVIGAPVLIKYVFPLPEGASAISLRWNLNDKWREASLKKGEQDTTLPGDPSGRKSSLDQYLGGSPVYFPIPAEVRHNKELIVEISYVQFLKYDFGSVEFVYPNDYTVIQTTPLEKIEVDFSLKSDRTIEEIECPSHTAIKKKMNQNDAYLWINSLNQKANKDIKILYKISSSELGLFGYSTFLGECPDSLGRGYFLFVVEPDPSEKTEAMNKIFTLIIDRSGSMGGSKIIQARNAANFIVNNLNKGDYFNIIDFASGISSLSEFHIPYNSSTKRESLDYIGKITASGMTNISGAFSKAIPQFLRPNQPNEESNFANIILFFTDGKPTGGISDTDKLLEHIASLNQSRKVTIFPFGIGNDNNKRLLTLMADQNYGLAGFLEDNELEASISNFYLKIRNPVLFNPEISFTPNVVSETLPENLANLYKGQQLLLAGRYSEPVKKMIVRLKGVAYGEEIEYKYLFGLAGSANPSNIFLTKIWAKMKIENLLVDYYSSSSTKEADSIKNVIIDFSLMYGIFTEFTHYEANRGGGGYLGGGYVCPVELTSFDGFIRKSGVDLQWETSSEINNMGFYIEKKIFNEETEWAKIAFISGAGNSTDFHYYNYLDKDVSINNAYQYRLRQIDLGGSSDPESISKVITIKYDRAAILFLEQNMPNPFRNTTTIKFELAQKTNVRLEILDIFGNVVYVLVDKILDPKTYEFVWNGTNSIGESIPGGTYLCRLIAGEKIRTIKIILIR